MTWRPPLPPSFDSDCKSRNARNFVTVSRIALIFVYLNTFKRNRRFGGRSIGVYNITLGVGVRLLAPFKIRTGWLRTNYAQCESRFHSEQLFRCCLWDYNIHHPSWWGRTGTYWQASFGGTGTGTVTGDWESLGGWSAELRKHVIIPLYMGTRCGICGGIDLSAPTSRLSSENTRNPGKWQNICKYSSCFKQWCWVFLRPISRWEVLPFTYRNQFQILRMVAFVPFQSQSQSQSQTGLNKGCVIEE